MGKAYGIFRFQKGDLIQDDKRSLEILDNHYVAKIRHKKDKEYTLNEKRYTYKCLICGNIDEITEDHLLNRKSGCNVCCGASRKILKGINDISSTAPWMMKYIVDKDFAYNNPKYSKQKTLMVCPDCGREYYKTPYTVYASHGLGCICGDGKSYPNKFVFSMLEQTGVEFTPEKSFEWSDNRVYDEYIEFNGKCIIIETNGVQHYHRSIHAKSRTVDEEKQNDEYKKRLALENGIDYYFIIDASESTCEFIKDSIIKSGLLDVLKVSYENIDWGKCDEFATSNLYRLIAEYHESNPDLNTKEVEKHFKVSSYLLSNAIKAGIRFGWCTKSFRGTMQDRRNNGTIILRQKPIYCPTNDKYYRQSSIASEILSKETDLIFGAQEIRTSIRRNRDYKRHKFMYITREQFNAAKSQSPEKCYGDFFIIKEKSYDPKMPN